MKMRQILFHIMVFGGGTPLFGFYRYVPLDRVWFFGLAVLNRVYNLTCLCPKQGMVLRAERLKPRLRPRAAPYERLKEFATADKPRVSFPDLHNMN